jgi:hypothetical protein
VSRPLPMGAKKTVRLGGLFFFVLSNYVLFTRDITPAERDNGFAALALVRAS